MSCIYIYTYLRIHMRTHRYICIYIHTDISGNIGGHGLRAPTGAVSWHQGVPFLILAAFLYRNRPDRVLDAIGPNEQIRTQRSTASGAVYIFVEMRPFLWSISGPTAVPGGPRGSQGRPQGVSGTSPGVPWGVPGPPRGVPRGPRGVPGIPGASPGVSGACPGDSWDPRGLQGRPWHPRDPFRKDDSVI